MENSDANPVASGQNTKTPETRELRVILKDMNQDGLVIYDSFCRKTSKNRKVGYCLTCEMTLGSFVKIYEHKNAFPSHAKIFFECEICHQTFIGRDTLRFHKEKHIQKQRKWHLKQFECHICFHTFSRKSNLKTHVRRVHGEKHCDKCGETFKDGCDLRNHMKCHTDWKYKCSVCGYSCNSKTILNKHKTVHSNHRVNIKRRALLLKQRNKKINKCQDCSATFDRQTSLQLHVHKVHYMKLICEICRKKFASYNCLKEHFKEHNVPMYSCALCNKDMLDLEFCRKQHLISEHGGIFQCRICEKIFHSANVISFHYKFMHPSDETFSCDQCGDMFVTEDTEERHKQWCRNTNDDPDFLSEEEPSPVPAGVNCSTCHKNFPNLHSLQNHLLSLDCQPVEKEETDFDSLQALDLRIVTEPSDESSAKAQEEKSKKKASRGPVQCDICNITFKNKLKLNKHKWNVHTNDFLPEVAKEEKKIAGTKNMERRNSAGRKSIEVTNVPDE